MREDNASRRDNTLESRYARRAAVRRRPACRTSRCYSSAAWWYCQRWYAMIRQRRGGDTGREHGHAPRRRGDTAYAILQHGDTQVASQIRRWRRPYARYAAMLAPGEPILVRQYVTLANVNTLLTLRHIRHGHQYNTFIFHYGQLLGHLRH